MLTRKNSDNIENIFKNKLAHVKSNSTLKKGNEVNKITPKLIKPEIKTTTISPIKRLESEKS